MRAGGIKVVLAAGGFVPTLSAKCSQITSCRFLCVGQAFLPDMRRQAGKPDLQKSSDVGGGIIKRLTFRHTDVATRVGGKSRRAWGGVKVCAGRPTEWPR
jgi:hypothetical protein